MLQTQRIRILDTWSNFDFKSKFWGGSRSPAALPNWAGYHTRRLKAYCLLEAYYSINSRFWLESEDNTVQVDRREYGDPFVIVETALTSLIGDNQKIVVEGSLINVPESVALQEAIEDWAGKEKFYLKMVESERQSVKYGDSVYVLGWDAEKGRARLNVYDPGFYFPIFDESSRGSEDFPEKVIIAYDYCEPGYTGIADKFFVRRICWYLEDVEPYTTVFGTPATQNCRYEDYIYEMPNMAQDIKERGANPYKIITEETYLDMDFIPVVHIPNTVNLQNHFGRSVLSPIIQILDDIQSTDTDLQASSATTGSPPIVVTGRGSGSAEVDSYGPGTIFYVGDGNATLIDTSTSLDALLKLKDALLERLSVNSRTPESLLGRVKPNEVPSGIALSLSFTPHSGMIKEMRLIRRDKYSLLLKFINRFLMITDPSLMEIPTNLHFGSFLPSDKQETMTLVVQLLGAKSISLETGVQMLMQAGLPIESWIDEIERIRSRDFDAANNLMNITGDPNSALAALGLPPQTEFDPADPTQDMLE